jgi:DNA-directed RNA polymerase specialized sigma subunit
MTQTLNRDLDIEKIFKKLIKLFTTTEISKATGITRQTINKWKLKIDGKGITRSIKTDPCKYKAELNILTKYRNNNAANRGKPVAYTAQDHIKEVLEIRKDSLLCRAWK